jgi:hypothetical protein
MNGDRYRAVIKIDGTRHYIGQFKTKEEAGIAYDRFVVDKSTAAVMYLLWFVLRVTGQRLNQPQH